MRYNYKLFILRIATSSYNYLLRIIISYFKPGNYLQTNDFYWIEMIFLNLIIIGIW